MVLGKVAIVIGSGIVGSVLTGGESGLPDFRDAISGAFKAGSEVILFAMSSNEKVAKATVVSVNPNNELGGVALGMKFCEVIVDVVLKRETLLPRPYADFKTLGDAIKMPVAWPFNRLKECSQQPKASQAAAAARSFQRSQGGAAAGSSQRSQGDAAGSSQRS